MTVKRRGWEAPKSLLLLGERVSVEVVADPSTKMAERQLIDGYYDAESNTITLRSQSSRRMFQTMWHESFHATLGETQVKPLTEAEEEALCDAFSKLVVRMLVSNPAMRTPP